MTITTHTPDTAPAPVAGTAVAPSSMAAVIGWPELLELVTEAAATLSRRPSLPILAAVRLTVGDGTLTVAGFDYETSYTRTVPAAGTVTGPTVAVAGRLLLDILKAAGKQTRTVAIGTGTVKDDGTGGPAVTVTTDDGTAYTLPAWPLEDAPELPTLPAGAGFWQLEPGALDELVRVSCAVGKDDTLPTLTGIMLELEPTRITAAATDRYRLAAITVPATGARTAAILVPWRELAPVVKRLRGTVTVGTAAGEPGAYGMSDPGGVVVLSDDDGRTYTVRTLDGAFPKWRALMPTGDDMPTVTAGAPELLAAVKRAAVVAERNTPVRLTVDPSGTVTVAAGGGDEARCAATVKGATADPRWEAAAFNPAYLSDAVAAVGAKGAAAVAHQLVRIGQTSPVKPALLTRDGDPMRVLLMPVRLAG
jgi:DNA polymerase III subunit beta